MEELGVLEPGDDTDEETATEPQSQSAAFRPIQGMANRGSPWFESLVEGSQLGRIKRQKGGHMSSDGSVQVEWEVVEWTEEEDDSGALGKRKLGEIEEDDVEMKT